MQKVINETSIKDTLFEYIRKKNGIVSYDELENLILLNFPNSKWKKSHWAWYKAQISSPKGKYYDLFPESVRNNLNSVKKSYRNKNESIISKKPNTNANYFEFIDNSNNVERDVAFALAKVCYHIHPKIVEKIIEDNKIFKYEILKHFNDNDTKSFFEKTFFYEGSDCIFPGVRRPVNKEKSQNWKNNINVEDYTILNDNTIPRHIWSFLSMDKPYNGNMWSKSGLAKFELAHIFGHKKDEKRLEKKVFSFYDVTKLPFAYFTSASNVVLIPNGLMKPTDTFEIIKIAFYKRHIDLYGENAFHAEREFNNKFIPEWYSELKWQDPPLPNDWERKINNLLRYRKQFLIRKYKQLGAIHG